MEWRIIPNYEDYQVSNTGKVKGLKGQLLKGGIDTRGYSFVYCRGFHMSIHRAVALAFIPNLLNLSQVNHKNEVKSDNRVGNLEWCTNKYNSDYSISKPVLMLDISTEVVIKRFKSLRDTDIYFGKQVHQSIGNVCNHKPKYITAYGYKWKYE